MRRNAARLVRAKAPVRRRTDWTIAKDRALVWGLIKESDNARQEFSKRFSRRRRFIPTRAAMARRQSASSLPRIFSSREGVGCAREPPSRA